ncbi:hypothetical protein [Rhodanobacter sp. DHB23]|uniref:YncE family protein n=1 Tax=Rhodanobacter sp. DHB23 TaxID=2775923 RepID=UPI001784F360|nr:hypothetical protein [Rhodanobacter sp. DHB23]MBD8872064.1 hypothetical protein [Rhodanobacter sp. DHB23]
MKHVLFWLFGMLVPAFAGTAQAAACTMPTQAARVAVPGHPFSALSSADGCWAFVSLTIDRQHGAVAVLRNQGGTFQLDHTVPMPAPAYGESLSHDGRLLAVAERKGADVFDVAQLENAQGHPLLGELSDGMGSQAVYALVSNDGRLLFVSQELAHAISVFDLAKAAGSGFRGDALAGRIPLAPAPVGLAQSPDGQWLYATSEIAPRTAGLDATCTPETKDERMHPPGLLFRIDVAKVASAPRKAVQSVVAAGCNPVRVAVAPAGDTIWVTARGSGALLEFRAGDLLSASGRSAYASFAIGTSPVGVAVRPDGRQVWAALSSRFGAAAAGQVAGLTLVDGVPKQMLTAAASGFPREVSFLPDGRTLMATLYDDAKVELIPTPP